VNAANAVTATAIHALVATVERNKDAVGTNQKSSYSGLRMNSVV